MAGPAALPRARHKPRAALASVPQLAVLVAGVALGLPAWAAWPVWFVLAGREVWRHGVPGQQNQQDTDQQQTTPEEEPCPPSPASTTSR